MPLDTTDREFACRGHRCEVCNSIVVGAYEASPIPNGCSDFHRTYRRESRECNARNLGTCPACFPNNWVSVDDWVWRVDSSQAEHSVNRFVHATPEEAEACFICRQAMGQDPQAPLSLMFVPSVSPLIMGQNLVPSVPPEQSCHCQSCRY